MVEQLEVPTLLCIASYLKGEEFLREARRIGLHVILLTLTDLEDADWPRESIDEFYAMPDLDAIDDVINGVSFLARTRRIERIVALDEYDVPLAAALREHLRLSGMSQSQTRFFRDKLAMRLRASQAGVLVPEFTPVFNNDAVNEYLQRIPPPWLLKPRSEATAIGIARVENADAVWDRLDRLGDRRSHFLLEQFVPGDVYHVDSIVNGGQVLFAEAHQYGRPPMDVFHGGGISMSRTLSRESEDAQLLGELNGHLLTVLGMGRGVSHMEFIRGHADGRFYFLEVAMRVGGAYTADMVEAATGINLWREWARLEAMGSRYALPERRHGYGGVIISLARQETPDTSAYADPEIVYRVTKHHHVGFVLGSDRAERILEVQDAYSRRIAQDFAASMPALEERPID
jgi:biotin carboxylase